MIQLLLNFLENFTYYSYFDALESCLNDNINYLDLSHYSSIAHNYHAHDMWYWDIVDANWISKNMMYGDNAREWWYFLEKYPKLLAEFYNCTIFQHPDYDFVNLNKCYCLVNYNDLCPISTRIAIDLIPNTNEAMYCYDLILMDDLRICERWYIFFDDMYNAWNNYDNFFNNNINNFFAGLYTYDSVPGGEWSKMDLQQFLKPLTDMQSYYHVHSSMYQKYNDVINMATQYHDNLLNAPKTLLNASSPTTLAKVSESPILRDVYLMEKMAINGYNTKQFLLSRAIARAQDVFPVVKESLTRAHLESQYGTFTYVSNSVLPISRGR